MPSVHKRNKSRFWHAAFTLPSGERRLRSTKTTDKSKAIQIALALQRAADAKNARDQAAKVVSDIVKIITGEGVEAFTVVKFSEEWLLQKSLEGSPGTHTRYSAAISNYLPSIDKNLKMNEVSANQLTTWRNSEAKRTSVATANLQLKILRMMFKDAMRVGVLSENPAVLVRPLTSKKTENRRRPFTFDEMRRILPIIPEDNEWHGMTLFGLYTGQRLGDVARCKDAAIVNGVWKARTTKTGLDVRIPLAPPLLEWLKTWKRKAFLFPNAAETAKDGKVGTLSNQFYEWLVKAGLAEPRPHTSRGKGRTAARSKSELSFHSLRHTLTTWLEEAGVSKAVAMEFVGHESESINQTYTHSSFESLTQAAAKLPDITKG